MSNVCLLASGMKKNVEVNATRQNWKKKKCFTALKWTKPQYNFNIDNHIITLKNGIEWLFQIICILQVTFSLLRIAIIARWGIRLDAIFFFTSPAIIAHVRCITILKWFRGFRDKIANFSRLQCLAIDQFRIKNYRWIQTLTAHLYRVSLDVK